jgi:hypothetical protein
MPSQKHPYLVPKVGAVPGFPLSLYVARLSLYFYCMFLRFFSFWYVIKKTKNPAMARLVARFTLKIRAIYFLIIKLSAPRWGFKRSKGKGEP